MTDPYRSSLIERLYREALELDLAERQSFLARRCGENIELQREVENIVNVRPFQIGRDFDKERLGGFSLGESTHGLGKLTE